MRCVKYFDEQWALERAVEAASNSKCKSQRGVVIWHRNIGLISSGWNAPPKPYICDGSETCRANCAKTAVHAEQAALLNIRDIRFLSEIDLIGYSSRKDCEMIHVKIVDGEPVFSEKPSCWQCSKLILASGLKSMWLYQKEGFVGYTPEEFHEQTLINCDLKQH
jgi:deoxycytidylate deaminase